MNRRNAVLAGLAISLAAAVVWAWPEEPRVPALAPEVPAAAPAVPAVSPPAAATSAASGDANATRTVAPGPLRTASPPANQGQGLRGLVLDTDGRPLPGLPVYLVDSASNDPVALPLLQLQREAFGPVASAETAADGTFAVGVPVVQDRVYELYVVSKQHATARLGGLRLLAGHWHELDAIRLGAGATVRGRVTVAGRDDIPVPMATVTVEVVAAFDDAALRALPEAGQGLCTTADAHGNYELRHIPSRGAVQLVAVAPGFARLAKANVELTLDRPVEVDFGLSPGTAIRGEVADSSGRPIAGARVEAWRTSPGGPLVANSDDAGRFEVLGLSAGKYRLRFTARGYERHDEEEVASDRNDVRVVLYEQSRVRVTVRTQSGEVLRSYQLGLRRVFPEQGDQIAAVTEVAEQRVRLDGLTDASEIRGVPVGVFACQVEAEGYAKALSVPFDNRREAGAPPGPRAFDVVVVATPGATLRGRVFAETGEPLAGATLVTQRAGTVPDSPLLRLLANHVPDRITAARATTAADGSFVLPRLSHADYQLQIDHPDACREFVSGIRLDRDGDFDQPPIRMRGGALVSGRATVNGRIAGQLKIVLTTPATVASAHDALRLETITDPEGGFRFTRRVPPGTYELRATAVGTAEPEAQIFRQLLQLQRSSTTLSVGPGQRQVERDIDLPSDH